DPSTVDDERHGVRGSIIGRMRRHGGSAEIRSEAGAGTEVRLTMPTPAEPKRAARMGDWLGGVWAADAPDGTADGADGAGGGADRDSAAEAATGQPAGKGSA